MQEEWKKGTTITKERNYSNSRVCIWRIIITEIWDRGNKTIYHDLLLTLWSPQQQNKKIVTLFWWKHLLKAGIFCSIHMWLLRNFSIMVHIEILKAEKQDSCYIFLDISAPSLTGPDGIFLSRRTNYNGTNYLNKFK